MVEVNRTPFRFMLTASLQEIREQTRLTWSIKLMGKFPGTILCAGCRIIVLKVMKALSFRGTFHQLIEEEKTQPPLMTQFVPAGQPMSISLPVITPE